MEFLITKSELTRAVKKLPINSPAGRDAIEPIFIKECIEVLAPAFLDVLNHSYRNNDLPEDWRFPVLRIVRRGIHKNYRPVI